MKVSGVPRATLGRLPSYLGFLKELPQNSVFVSATRIAKGLGLGEVMVRKDLNAVSGAGKPKVGYVTADLIAVIEKHLGLEKKSPAVIVGAGKLGLALYDYSGFSDYGLDIVAAFDCDAGKLGLRPPGKEVYPMDRLASVCREQGIKIGIITVPASSAQRVCDLLVKSGIKALWNFAPVKLSAPEGVIVRQQDLALSLAHLNQSVNQAKSE